jgi:hypothetical protein
MPWPSQDRALARYVANEAYPYSSAVRRRLDTAGLGRKGIRGVEDLARLPAIDLSEVGDGRELVLRPDEDTLRVFHGPLFALALAWARLRGRAGTLQRRVLEPRYKPLEWLLADGVPLAYSAADLVRLGELGRRWLWQAGIGPGDVVVDLLAPELRLAALQLSAGCRVARVAHVHLPPTSDPGDVAWLGPTALAGSARHLGRVLRGVRSAEDAFASLRTLLVTGELLDPRARTRLARLAPPSVAIVQAWAPPGVRALWAECRGGDALHAWPDVEVIETGDDGLVWTGLGWRGSALLRLRTGVDAVTENGPCPHCGQEALRLRVASTS